MEELTSASTAPPNGTTKSKLPQIDPFTSAESIVQSLQVQDAQLLQASLVQIDKRAAALNAKPAPRGSPDLLLDYLKKFPGCDGIFHAWDYANKTNNSPLSTAILSCLTSLIRLLSTDPFTPSPDLIKTLLSSKYTPYLERALNPGRNDVTTSALRLCNVLVGFAGGRFAKKLFGAFGWSPKVTTRLYKTRLRSTTSANVLNKPDIRTLLVLLVLSFLSAGDTRLKSQVLETKGLVSGIFKGLNEDPEVVVNLVLEVFFREIVQDRRVGLEARRNVFDESCVNELVKLYDYPLPTISDESPLPASHPTVSVHRFFYALTDWLSDQIASSPVGRSFGPQKILSNLLKSLQVTEDQSHRTLALHILEKSPILSGQFWSKFPSSLDPRLSSRWISAITFATQVVALPVSKNLELPSSSTTDHIDPVTFAPPSVQSILDTILPPSPPSSQTLSRTWYTKSLTHANPLVSFLSSIFLLSILQKASKVLEAMMKVSQALEEDGTKGGRWVESMRRIREEIKNKVPDVGLVVGLMSRTAAAAAATSTTTKEKAKAGGKEVAEKGKAEESAALLRTNIALRLLYLYHRVVPSLIATLKFDFTKLPQTFAIKPESKASEEEGEGEGQGGEGLRAMSSSHALRLAAVHESGAASFNRPGDHFKSLLPLFSLYRVSSLTPSNRSLLLQTLKRQLSTPLLFGEGEERLDEVEVWLESLPTPIEGDDEADVKESIDWFEKVVQKTLTAPIKPKVSEEEEEQNSFSPLMKNALISLETAKSQPSQALQSLLQSLFVNYLAHSPSMDQPTKLYESIKLAWKEHKDVVKPTLKTLSDVLEVVKGGEEKKFEAGDIKERIEKLVEDEEEDKIAQVLRGLNPRKENVFVAFDGEAAGLEKVLSQMPLSLVYLHARASDILAVTSLLHLWSSSASLVSAAQIILYRFINASSNEDRETLGKGLTAVHVAADERQRAQIRARIAATNGALRLLETERENGETAQVVSQLVASIFSASNPQDVEILRPFASLLVLDLADSDENLSPRVIGCASLLSFFSSSIVTSFAKKVLSLLPSSPDSKVELLVTAVLDRVDSVPASPQFDEFWIENFSSFVQLSSSSNTDLRQAADRILAKGSSSLLVSSTSTGSIGGSRSSSPLPFDEWTFEILSLSTSELSSAQATVLSALLSRSPEARKRFLNYLQEKASSQFNAALELPLKTLLEVSVVREEKITLDESLVKTIVESVLSRAQVVESSLLIVELLAAVSPSASSLIRSTLEANLASTERDGYKASTVALVGRLAQKDDSLRPVLEGYVNGSFEGLTRKFVDAKEEEQVEEALSRALAHVLVKQQLSLKGHLVEPLVTAIATNRLNYAETADLAVAICKRHQFKDNEVTRHLNEIFASQPFQDYVAAATTIEEASLSTVKLVLALAAQSPSAAGNARSVERLIPFYRGTLSSLDRSFFDLFLRIEQSSSSSVSPLFASWNPSTDSTTLLDGTRIGALGAVRKPFVRRSWLRAFASTRIVYAKEEDSKTYDPRFLVAYALSLIEEESLKPQEWTTFLESGVLGTVIASLAATDNGLRKMARTTLALMYKKVEPLNFRERDEVVLLLAHCRNATFSPAGEPIPSTIALFLAHCALQLGTPASPLYPTFTRFLLQRSTIDMRDVPMFYTMMYSSNSDEWAAAPREERGWMIRYLTEGLVRTQDWKIYRRRQVFELVASLFHSSRQDVPLRKLILEFIIRATTIPTAARELLSRNGLVGWIAAQTPLDSTERRHCVTILSNLTQVMTFDKLTGVADLLDALTAVIGSDMSSIDSVTLLSLLHYIVSRLPAPSDAQSPTLVLILNRLSLLLTSLASTLPHGISNSLAQLFYSTAVSVAFVKFEAGLKENEGDRENWKLAIKFGLQAGVEDLGKEVMKLQ
ncbi:Urb1p [Sporobolomyces salmoneus]|uniref:Urb1p n=1 Tax=Sporobolomyces salmoneus TaxID=183962 RepID=UPI0031754C20